MSMKGKVALFELLSSHTSNGKKNTHNRRLWTFFLRCFKLNDLRSWASYDNYYPFEWSLSLFFIFLGLLTGCSLGLIKTVCIKIGSIKSITFLLCHFFFFFVFAVCLSLQLFRMLSIFFFLLLNEVNIIVIYFLIERGIYSLVSVDCGIFYR